jgi:hypothetical protein
MDGSQQQLSDDYEPVRCTNINEISMTAQKKRKKMMNVQRGNIPASSGSRIGKPI